MTRTGLLLDTTFVIDVLRGTPEALSFDEHHERVGTVTYLSSQTYFELYVGIELAVNGDRERELIRDVVDSKRTLPAETTVMKQAGMLYGRLQRDGQMIEPADCVIAATALIEGLPVVTRNDDHFERIDGLDVRRY